MSDSTLIQVLLYGHIVSAIGLLGGALLFTFAIGPVLPRLSPATRGEIIVKLLPRIAQVLSGFGVLLTLFGIALAYEITGGDFSQFSSSNPWGARISVGIFLGLIAVILALGVIQPTVSEMGRIQAAVPADAQGPPPARFMALMGRLKVTSLTAQIIMLATIVFMVASAEL
ncbi:MAG: hypothetical protein L3K06_03520 [Thermoplasmata archaeon]|nr:hypothetical protein [Thermoplasmata archaeon]MCI4354416.1 hypothetical protein [Thermoplasmata archaeon]